MSLVFAMTLPGLVVLLILVAAIDQLLLRLRRRGLISWRQHSQVSSTGFELLQVAFSPGKQHELDQRRTQLLLRDEADEGAPPSSRVDLDRGVAYLRACEGAPRTPSKAGGGRAT